MPGKSFRIGPIRPPSEASSLLLQVTRGCTWNRCRFCTIYRDTSFQAFSADSIKKDIDSIASIADTVRGYAKAGRWDLDALNAHLASIENDDERQSFYMVASWLLSGGENVFLQDGNTTALSSGRLSDVLVYLKQTFPQIRRITSYGRASELSRHDAAYFAELKKAGLDRIHSGFESGSDAVLSLIGKGTSQEQQIRAGKNVKAGGIELSIYFMPGIGGKALTAENAEGTAQVVNEVHPDFLRIRTAAIKPGTELFEDFRAGSYRLCSDDDKVREIRRVITLAKGAPTSIVSDHMVNLLQEVNGRLDTDSASLLEMIDRYLDMPEADRRTFQLLRRTLQAYAPGDLKNIPAGRLAALRESVMQESEESWSEQMNALIGRYI